MAIVVNIYYTGQADAALSFAREMTARGIVEAIRAEKGNLRYEYFLPMDRPDTVLLIDMWEDQAALDLHHALPLMQDILRLREQYGLTMRVERYVTDETGIPESDRRFIRER